MVQEKQPRPGSNSAIVLHYLDQGINRDEIPVLTGLSSNQVSRAERNLSTYGYVDAESSQVERRRHHSEAISRSRGGLGLLVAPLARIGLSALETQEALRQEHGTETRYRNVKVLIHKIRRKENLPSPSKDEISDIARNNSRSRLEIAQRVRIWIDVYNRLSKENPENMPQSRTSWIKICNFFSGDLLDLGFADVSSHPFIQRGVSLIEIVNQETQEPIFESDEGQDKRKRYELAKGFIKKGLVTRNLGYFEQLGEAYRLHGREIPEDPLDRIRMEVYVAAIDYTKKGYPNAVEVYRKIGKKVDEEWFNGRMREDEQFISSALESSIS